MKKIKYIISFLLFFLLGCNDFLDYKENDKLIPKTIENYSEFLFGQVMNDQQDFNEFMVMMSDDVSEVVLKFSETTDNRLDALSYYTWKAEIEQDYKGTIVDNTAWAKLYHKILICNIIINEISELDLKEKEKKKKALLEGEALFLRADAYFRLVNLFGEPFISEEQANTALGVPINDEIGVSDKLFSRSSVSEVYKKIEKDLSAAIHLFENNQREYPSIFRPNLDVAKLLLSRVYLYQKKYKKTLELAENLIQNSDKVIFDFVSSKVPCLLIKANTGILFTYEKVDYRNMNSSGTTHYGASDGLRKLFIDADVRKKKFFYDNNKTKPRKYKPGDSNTKGKAFRIEEAYLNKAEALVELGKYQEAMHAINAIREFRIVGDYKLVANSKEQAEKLVREERRRELCFEFHRWFDLRRYGMPELKHKFSASNGTITTYILEKGSASYTLPIPYNVRKFNSEIKNIQRPQIKTE